MKKLLANFFYKKDPQKAFLKKISKMTGSNYTKCRNPPVRKIKGATWYVFSFENISFYIGFLGRNYYLVSGTITNKIFLKKRKKSFFSYEEGRWNILLAIWRVKRMLYRELSFKEKMR